VTTSEPSPRFSMASHVAGMVCHAMRVGVFGGAFVIDPRTRALARGVGLAIAKRGLVTVTGATSGLPHVAGRSALKAGGVVLGVSPARDAVEHKQKYRKPLNGCSHIFYTGQGYTGRNYLNLRNCDLAIFLGGEAGTLEEYCIGVYEGLVLGALTNSGGVCEILPEVVKRFRTKHGGAFCFGIEPHSLLDEMIAVHKRLPKRRIWTIGG
jgi:uncharacterized protein (TIGR00725 family)